MPPRSLDTPRAPFTSPKARLYESHYLTAVAPGGGRALWLRYTSLKRAGGHARGALWCTLFEAGESPIARRRASPEQMPAPPPGAWTQVEAATIGPGYAQGRLEDCEWKIAWEAQAPPLPYLPSPWLYDRPLPRSNGAALVPSATFAGHLGVAHQRLDLTGWRGMVGHNWGADHAERWIWLHASGLGQRDPHGWIDLILARIRLGPVLSPWLPAGGVQLDGKLRLIRAGASSRGLRLEVQPETLNLALPRVLDGGLMLWVTSPAASTVRWDYASPRSRGREVSHCSISSARVQIAAAPAFELFHSFSVEIGM